MKIASRATPEGLAGHGLSTTVLDLCYNIFFRRIRLIAYLPSFFMRQWDYAIIRIKQISASILTCSVSAHMHAKLLPDTVDIW